jgi:hypothetical protein
MVGCLAARLARSCCCSRQSKRYGTVARDNRVIPTSTRPRACDTETMTSETKEHAATQKAFDEIVAYLKAGNSISWSCGHVAESLYADSFLAGGDASNITKGGKRGTLTSQLSTAALLSNDGGVTKVPISMTMNLDTGAVALAWGPDSKEVTLHVELVKRAAGQSASVDLVFAADSSSDLAGYSLLLMLI